jgi:hypothetical protein
MGSKIALLGSAPSSIRLAPLKDPAWSIWACSPGAYAIIGQERTYHEGDAFFELHRWEPPVIGDPTRQVAWFSPEYVEWMRQFKGPVYTGEVIPDIPRSVRLPRERLLERYGPYFFTSSLAWMLAMALEVPDVEEIALYGVDMSATEEYAQQRPGCHFFIQAAMLRGVRVSVPPESDLMQPMPLYGICEWEPMMVKATVRKRELEARLVAAQASLQAATQQCGFLQGALDNHKYWMATWIGTASIDRIVEQMARRADVVPLHVASD